MAELEIHLDRLIQQCCELQEHGHLDGVPDGFAAVSDIEIKIQDLKDVFERHIEDAS